MRGPAAPSVPLHARAPAKINLGLFVGPARADGRHELVTVMQSISLADELTLRGASGDDDVVVCPGVPGPVEDNLAARALAAFRAASGWAAPPLELWIDKRVPVAAGLGGGSGDAAATLRLAAAAAAVAGLGGEGDDAELPGRPARELGADAELLGRLARELGADVPAQVRPGRWLASGAGELLRELPAPVAPLGVLVLPGAQALATAAVYAQADRMGPGRSHAQLHERHLSLGEALAHGAPLPDDVSLLANDLQDAARALCPAIDIALAQARAAGADVALVSGSGPTVVGLFAGAQGPQRARAGAQALARERVAAGATAPIAAEPVTAAFGEPRVRQEPGHDPRMRHNSRR
jgi:4-diphosphocytidyl-2-C-methyl-D-erythritol kinase